MYVCVGPEAAPGPGAACLRLPVGIINNNSNIDDNDNNANNNIGNHIISIIIIIIVIIIYFMFIMIIMIMMIIIIMIIIMIMIIIIIIIRAPPLRPSRRGGGGASWCPDPHQKQYVNPHHKQRSSYSNMSTAIALRLTSQATFPMTALEIWKRFGERPESGVKVSCGLGP